MSPGYAEKIGRAAAVGLEVPPRLYSAARRREALRTSRRYPGEPSAAGCGHGVSFWPAQVLDDVRALVPGRPYLWFAVQ